MNNPPAFPIPDVRTHDGMGISEGSPGMTLRDWFAGQALAGSMAFHGSLGMGFGPGEVAARAYEIADAMLGDRALATGETPR